MSTQDLPINSYISYALSKVNQYHMNEENYKKILMMFLTCGVPSTMNSNKALLEDREKSLPLFCTRPSAAVRTLLQSRLVSCRHASTWTNETIGQ